MNNTRGKAMEKKYVYCSGPLFCPEEIGGMTAISSCLENQGYGTFLPHRDGLEAQVIKLVNSPVNVNIFNVRSLIDRAIFALDVYQIIERCDYFVFNMNGRVPDEGGVAETAIAFSAGKPIIIYKNDARTAFKGLDNSMITGLAYSTKVNKIEKIPGELEKVAERLLSLGENPYKGENLPPVMRKTVDFGRKVWKFTDALHRDQKKPDVLIDEISRLCMKFDPLDNQSFSQINN